MSTDSQPNVRTGDAQRGAGLNRRQFLTRMSLALGGLGAALVGIPVVGFLLGPLLRRTGELWQPVGSVDAFQVGAMAQISFIDPASLRWGGVGASATAWLHRIGEQEFNAFATNCTHLGCPVRWQPDAELFICPCHSGAFYRDGSVASGPPPRPLQRYQVRVRNGQVELLAGSELPVG